MHPITALLTTLGALTVFYVASWAKLASAAARGRGRQPAPDTDARFPTALQTVLGAVTNFFDALGIGSFATSTAVFRFFKMVPDRIIPGTLNVGHALPTIAQAFVFTALIPVDVVTLVTMIVAAVLGAWVGAGIVARWPKRRVQLGMGAALLAAAVFMLMRQFGLFPEGSAEIGVRGIRLALAIGGNFALGALMTLGIGLYAPCMVLVSLLGMSERTAFPIMMNSCAFLMPVASLRFIREKSYSLRVAMGLALGGIAGSLFAGLVVKQMPLDIVRLLVIVVVVYAATMLLYAGLTEPDTAGEREQPA
jgi:uncharacterized membrane protein YfcA